MLAERSPEVEVLVVGAGPTGLTLAADLLRRGIRTRIVDQASGPNDRSRALGVQAGTLEALESTLGSEVSQRMVDLGRPARRATIHVDNRTEIEVDLSIIQSHYNFILVLDQSLTEKILAEEVIRYGCKIEWQTSFINLQQEDHSVLCEVSLPTGERQKISAQFVVGCDGAHSKVRKVLNVPFKGDQYEGEFILGDVQIEWPFSLSSIHVFLSEKGVMPCFPLNDKGLYRLIPIPKKKSQSHESEISFDEFSQIARSLASVDLKILSAQWITRFRVHHRMSRKFSVGRVFLAGDAAHIHSPAGGQGMNSGIQDSLNLSNKFHQVLRNGKKINLLSCYEKQRMPVAKKVLRGTDLAFRAALFPEGLISKIIRGRVLPTLVKTKAIRNQVIQAISEVNIARQEINLRIQEERVTE